MKHLLICSEYPPAPGGGIGRYVENISRLLAESGETVHVIGQLWEGAEKEVEERCSGRLIIHRIPFQDWTAFLNPKPSPLIRAKKAKDLFRSSYFPQCFSWMVAPLAEHLVVNEGIDIIEAPEYEAPLYYFQLRRSQGLGPKKTPTCLIHLHSPTEVIARYNDSDLGHPYHLSAKELEDYTIAAADALLCPSRYLARQVEEHYIFIKGGIGVIPYPLGDFPFVERKEETWERGKVCYVGRLEQRKGVIEWVEAALSLANKFPQAEFEFIGDSVPGSGINVKNNLKRLIPRDLKERFVFRGAQKHASLPKFLAHARIAVVPSRWENFPNSCVEAMGSGLPVIVSRSGGMVEMVEDNRSGWVAKEEGNWGLAEALTRALNTPPEKVAQMGGYASSAIRHMCDNQKIVRQQIDFRRGIVRGGEDRSLNLPANLPEVKESLSAGSERRFSQAVSRRFANARMIFLSNPGGIMLMVLRKIRSKILRRISLRRSG